MKNKLYEFLTEKKFTTFKKNSYGFKYLIKMLKVLSCMENGYFNIWWKFQVPRVIRFWITWQNIKNNRRNFVNLPIKILNSNAHKKIMLP